MLADFYHTLVVTVHTIYALAGLGKYKVVDPILAYFTLETVGVEGVVTSHDSFVEDR